MTIDDPSTSEQPDELGPSGPPTNSGDASRRWRTLWRTHFYAGIISAPVLLMFALTGLVILYTQPYLDATQGHLRVVEAHGERASFEAQKASAERGSKSTVVSVIVPRNSSASTEFGLEDGRSAFVDPYTKAYLGTADPGGGLVGLSNRMHGFLDNETVTVKLPNIAGPLSGGAWMQEFVVADMVLEVFAVWSMVLVASGLYLWWPRRSRAAGGRADKALLVPRVAKRGRARWRDLHAIPGMVLAVGTLFVLATGLFWSSYWAASYTAVANELTPNEWVDPPDSTLPTRGDLDRLGNHINWNTADRPIPSSDGTKVDPSSLPAPVSLDLLVAAAEAEHMKPGYSISYPVNGVDDAGNPTFSSFTISNSWPRKTGEAKDVYLDQFTGEKLAQMDIYGNGAVSVASDTLVSVHMGTQLGIASRVVMTGICLAVIWSVVSAVVMYGKRRRPGSLGLPRRPRDLRLAKGLVAILVVLGIVYPLWGVSALLVLGFDRFVVRKVPRLQVAFGQR